jgi:hypothetical protein
LEASVIPLLNSSKPVTGDLYSFTGPLTDLLALLKTCPLHKSAIWKFESKSLLLNIKQQGGQADYSSTNKPSKIVSRD